MASLPGTRGSPPGMIWWTVAESWSKKRFGQFFRKKRFEKFKTETCRDWRRNEHVRSDRHLKLEPDDWRMRKKDRRFRRDDPLVEWGVWRDWPWLLLDLLRVPSSLHLPIGISREGESRVSGGDSGLIDSERERGMTYTTFLLDLSSFVSLGVVWHYYFRIWGEESEGKERERRRDTAGIGKFPAMDFLYTMEIWVKLRVSSEFPSLISLFVVCWKLAGNLWIRRISSAGLRVSTRIPGSGNSGGFHTFQSFSL